MNTLLVFVVIFVMLRRCIAISTTLQREDEWCYDNKIFIIMGSCTRRKEKKLFKIITIDDLVLFRRKHTNSRWFLNKSRHRWIRKTPWRKTLNKSCQIALCWYDLLWINIYILLSRVSFLLYSIWQLCSCEHSLWLNLNGITKRFWISSNILTNVNVCSSSLLFCIQIWWESFSNCSYTIWINRKGLLSSIYDPGKLV